jgi:hypothetical protein
MQDKREKQISAEQEKKLAEMDEKHRPMESVVLDGDKRLAYFIGKRKLDIDEVVVGVPFAKLLILLGQMLVAVIAPSFEGQRVSVTRGEVGAVKKSLDS